MESNLQIDQTDKKILSSLMTDARVSYLEIARECRISGPAVHQRIARMREAGMISGSHCC
jgi:Lrp/AsnC family transcriptional regulator, regulator for asnA, asnC and gidA